MAREPSRYADLESAIDAIRASYDAPLDINNLESAALPNRRAVVEAFNHLKHVVYMGFYSLRSLDRENLRHALSEHLYPAYEILVDQIHRALTYEELKGRMTGVAEGWSQEVLLRLFAKIPDLRASLNTDVIAAYVGDPAAANVEEIIFSYPSIEAITAHRIAHVLYSDKVPMIPRIIAEHAHFETGIDIHPGATIGDHFFIDHGTGVVIGETCVIGQRVKIYQGVTLGALSTTRAELQRDDGGKRHPTIEDDVTIYSGATILGGDTVIGHGSVVGGNQWLVRSVPPNSKVFG
ncbi:MAG TPA: serine O-acetyltransferase EpsC, partial [Polyangiaceae bacterium]|nr:serine O-acetyltransferase EpsC [Polyangiaceae bacterium]